MLSPAVRPEVQGLLRSPSALYGWRGLCEDGLPALELSPDRSHLFSVLDVVDGANFGVGVFKSLLGAFDFPPVHLEPRRNDEMIVAKLLSPDCFDRIILGVDAGHILLGVRDLGGQDVSHGALGDVGIAEVGAQHRPPRLVIVLFSPFKDADVAARDAGPQQVTGDIEASGAASNNADLGVREKIFVDCGSNHFLMQIFYTIIKRLAFNSSFFLSANS